MQTLIKKWDYNEFTEEEEEEFPEQNTVRKCTLQRRQPYRRTKGFNFKKVDIHRSLSDSEDSSGETTEPDQEESIVFMPFSKELKSPEIVPSQLGGTNKQEPEQLEDRTMVQIQPQDGYEEQLPHDTIEARDSSKEVVLHEEPRAPVQRTNQTARDEVPDISQPSTSKGKKPTKKYNLRPRPYARTDHSWNKYKGNDSILENKDSSAKVMVEDASDETHDFKDDPPMSDDGEDKITHNDNVSMKDTSQETIIYDPTEFTRELSGRSDSIKRQRSDSTESTHEVGSEDIHAAKLQLVDDSEDSDNQEPGVSMVFNGSETFGVEDTNNVYSIAELFHDIPVQIDSSIEDFESDDNIVDIELELN